MISFLVESELLKKPQRRRERREEGEIVPVQTDLILAKMIIEIANITKLLQS